MKSALKNICTAVLLLSALAFVSCAEMFQGKISMDTDSDTATLGDLLKTEETVTSLDAPSQIFASEGMYSSSISVTWSKVTNARTYRLERAVIEPDSDGTYKTPSDSDYSVIVLDGYNTASLFTTSFTDTILDEAESSEDQYSWRYYYRVSASNTFEDYEESDYTYTQNNSSNCYGFLFAPPQGVKASQGADKEKITVSWEKVSGAQKYIVYRTTNEDGTASEKIGSVTANQNWYKDTITDSDFQGVEFYYTVTAVNSSSQTSAASDIAMGYTLVAGAPPKVENVRVTDGRGYSASEISIAWDAVTNGSSSVYYTVYRSSSVSSTPVLLKDGITVTSYTDKKSLKSGIYYYYYVQAWSYDLAGTSKLKASISESGEDSDSPAEGYVLSAPTTISAEKDSANTTVYFKSAIGSAEEITYYTYRIYGDSDSSGSFTKELAVVEGSDTLNDSGYYSVSFTTDSDCPYLKIRTFNSSGEQSQLSSVFASAPLSATNLVVSKNDYSVISAGLSPNKNEVYPVVLTWSAPSDTSLYGYYVYRASSYDGNYRCISDTMITADTTTYTDSNSTAKAGTVYFYKVLTVNSLNQGTKYSDAAWGYGIITSNQYMREYNKTIMASQDKLTLMHKSGNTAKLGTETISGDLSGTLYYNAGISGISGRVIMKYTEYADFYIHADGTKNTTAPEGTPADPLIGTKNGYYFFDEGNTNTSAGTDTNGTMDGDVICSGMYPGKVNYDSIEIKSGAAGGGYYYITRYDLNGNAVEDPQAVSYTVGNEK